MTNVVTLEHPGDTVSGMIVSAEDFQVTDPETGEPKFYGNGNIPIMGIRIVLEVNPGNPRSRVTLEATADKMREAIAVAVGYLGASGLVPGAELVVGHAGYEGQVMVYEAYYTPSPEDAEASR